MNPVIFDYWANLLRVLILLPFVFLKKREVVNAVRGKFKAVLIISCLSPAAYMLVLGAVQIAPLSHVAPARELSLMFGALLGIKLLDEGRLVIRLIASALIATGVILLALA